jgi:hypothetical protein
MLLVCKQQTTEKQLTMKLIKNMKIAAKLNSLCVSLVVIPLLLVGGFSLYELMKFSDEVTGMADERLTTDAEEQLLTGARTVRNEVDVFVDTLVTDTLKLAGSGTLMSYLEASTGESELWNRFSRTYCESILRGIVEGAAIQNASAEKTLKSSLALAEVIMNEYGPFKEDTNAPVEWKAINQFTRKEQDITLPEIRLGDTVIPQNADPDKPTPLVDNILERVGGAATVFQRMNAEGDMLRAATSIIGANGKRAIGTFIPAVMPDGKPNAVISTILNGETFIGRAFVVNAWYITAYQPIKDANGEITGILFVGLNENKLNAALIDSIVSIKVGESGYPFVMNTKGNLLVHPREDLVGKNVITDLNITEFQEPLDNRSEGEYGWTTYDFEGREKFIAYSYFPAWDWIVCVSGYLDEAGRDGAEAAYALFQNELLSVVRLSLLQTPNGAKPMYPQVRLFDPQGNEILRVIDGVTQPESELQSRAGENWFENAKKLPAGEAYITPVQVAKNTGDAEIRVVAPVYLNDVLRAVVVVNANWSLVWEILSDNAFGETGYAYIMDDQGVLISHPQYVMKDNVSLADANPSFLFHCVSCLFATEIRLWHYKVVML